MDITSLGLVNQRVPRVVRVFTNRHQPNILHVLDVLLDDIKTITANLVVKIVLQVIIKILLLKQFVNNVQRVNLMLHPSKTVASIVLLVLLVQLARLILPVLNVLLVIIYRNQVLEE